MRALRRLTTAFIALAATLSVAGAQDQMPWQPSLETAQQIAAQTNRLVLIHFWAPWCKPCARLDKDVFSHPETARALEANFVMVKLNVDETPATARLYGVSSLPSDVIVLPNGRLVSQFQSPPTASQYVTQMNQAAAGHRELVRRSMQQPPGPPGSQVAAAYVQPPPATAAFAPANMPMTPGAAPPSARADTTNQPGPPPQSAYANERYADYFRQHPGMPPQNIASPSQNSATPAIAYTAPPANAYAAPPANAYTAPPANAYTAPPANVTYTAPANTYTAPLANTGIVPPANVPASGAPPIAVANQVNPQPPAGPAAAAVSPNGPAAGSPPNYNAQAAYPPHLQLPPGCPPLGLDGNCPVTLVERKQWSPGDKAWGAVHRGRTYLFVGPQEKEKFLANPDRYSPVLSGNDPVLALDQQMAVPGRREFGVFGGDSRVYLFADEASLKRFVQNEKRYSAEVIQAMR
jgi:thiol-disulfide isomerase/thioredoxin/YHS domain-containing protein